ncbi:hypothetical protein AAZX31_03G185000 [Glycine max]|uniref:VQ domain-containing protein n=1 Tax=Glycine max TaxID=3847 RepID=I1JQC4_SOYBN|nr:hypothetical protein JHK87_007903 [Glycine soja]KAG5055787.1 hypothetical protein JHK85_008297 [Glycine max]KAG5072845.1 hypothetical protein JHK86_008056 [Glycine max]KAH1071002.1 hypothetical protein GYH30_007851 [Glycine max]KAH1258900.1 VQ motif-containing protein 8, chloroplastic [Glycine max]
MNSQATSRQKQLQGPKPASLMINRNSTKINKKQKQHLSHHSPVIVHLKSPKVIHVRPEEFMSLVQQLTRNPVSAAFAAPKMDKSSTVVENPIEDFTGCIGHTSNVPVDFQALMHFVDFF